MTLGLCLTGGGAKGAFQGGIIKGLYENNIVPEIITGTSIGAVNLYFMLKGCCRELELYWNNISSSKSMKAGWVIDNSAIIDKLAELSGDDASIRAAYVNYIKVSNKTMTEVIENIRCLSREDALNAVKYSSLLPSRPVDYSSEAGNAFDSRSVFNNFIEDMKSGIYEGYCLDGGIINNSLLAPIMEEKADRVLIVGLYDNYTPPEYIYNYYNEEDVIVCRPDIKINPMDTIRFEREFCRDLYQRGYKISETLANKLIKQG